MGRSGLEPNGASTSRGKHLGNPPKSSGADSGAESAETAPIDPDLAKLIDAWPDLPDAVRKGIVAMADWAKGD